MKNILPAVREIGQEVLAYADPTRVKDAAIYAEMTESDLEDALHKLYRHANTIPTGQGTECEPSSLLVQKMLEFRAKPDVVSAIGASVAGTCFQTELRFVRSLDRHQESKTAANRLPAAVLYDDESQPFAYQKADGHPTAYAWRSATVKTTAGPRWVPEGSIVEVAYGTAQKNGVYQADPRHEYRGSGLVSLSGAKLPDEVMLKRVGIEYLPDVLRETAVDFAITDVPMLGKYREQAVDFTAAGLASAVGRLSVT